MEENLNIDFNDISYILLLFSKKKKLLKNYNVTDLLVDKEVWF